MAQVNHEPEKYTIITGKLGTDAREDTAAILGVDRLAYNYKLYCIGTT